MADRKGLSENVISSSLSSIHVLFNQVLVGGLSSHLTPATRIANFQLDGGSTLPTGGYFVTSYASLTRRYVVRTAVRGTTDM